MRFSGLQIQQAHNKIYSGPGDAVKKIISSHGIAGLYKGQVATLYRETIGYGAYFWAYEKLMQRELKKHGIRRDQVSPVKAVLFGAGAGYAVSTSVLSLPLTRGELTSACSYGRAYTL